MAFQKALWSTWSFRSSLHTASESLLFSLFCPFPSTILLLLVTQACLLSGVRNREETVSVLLRGLQSSVPGPWVGGVWPSQVSCLSLWVVVGTPHIPAILPGAVVFFFPSCRCSGMPPGRVCGLCLHRERYFFPEKMREMQLWQISALLPG